MKKVILNYFLLALVCISIVACGGAANTEKEEDTTKDTTEVVDDAEAAKEFKKALKAYLDLKNALVSSDANGSRIYAKKLSGKVSDDIHNAAEELYGTDDIEAQRKIFNMLSQQMYSKVKEMGGGHVTVYKIYCPMALNHTGAFWLSAENVVKNPYFGDAMMDCGEVQEEIPAKS